MVEGEGIRTGGGGNDWSEESQQVTAVWHATFAADSLEKYKYKTRDPALAK